MCPNTAQGTIFAPLTEQCENRHANRGVPKRNRPSETPSAQGLAPISYDPMGRGLWMIA